MNTKNTIILFWNPEVSSFKIAAYQRLLENIKHGHMNWGIHEHEKAHFGDRFFMVCCGRKSAGICMSGYLVSEPYIDKDWAGKDRVVYYADIAIDYIINPTSLPILPSEEIMKEIPDFDWLGGHSGRVLAPEAAVKLEALWKTFVQQHINMFGLRANKQEITLDDYRENNKEFITLTIGEDGKVHGEIDYSDITAIGDSVDETIKQLQELLKAKREGKIEYEVEFDYVDDDMIPLYSKAVDLAIAKFRDQKDSFDKPYIAHLVRVAKDGFNADYRIVALLQDVFRQGYATPGSLFRMGFQQNIIDAIMSLTQKDGESFKDFIMRVDGNKLGRRVMMSNLEDELNFYRYEELKPEDLPLINEKLNAWRYLDNGDDNLEE